MKNSMCFEDRHRAMKLIGFLLQDEGDLFNDIRVHMEEATIIVEWEQVPFSGEWGGSFQYIDENHVVVYYGQFPDNHYEYFDSEDDFKEALEKFYLDNPDLKKERDNYYGI